MEKQGVMEEEREEKKRGHGERGREKAREDSGNQCVCVLTANSLLKLVRLELRTRKFLGLKLVLKSSSASTNCQIVKYDSQVVDLRG